jgi:hypothetical protein
LIQTDTLRSPVFDAQAVQWGDRGLKWLDRRMSAESLARHRRCQQREVSPGLPRNPASGIHRYPPGKSTGTN